MSAEPEVSRRPRLERWVHVALTQGRLGAVMHAPPSPRGAVLIGHPSGISRLSWRERFIARSLAHHGFFTLMVDLLTEEEDRLREGAHGNVALLAERILGCARWITAREVERPLPLGYLGVGAAAAGALVAAALAPELVGAVVCRGGRPDDAGASLLLTRVPLLFVVDGHDPVELAVNRGACSLSGNRQLEIVTSPGGAFREEEALDRVSALSAAWFGRWFEPEQAPGGNGHSVASVGGG